MELHRFVEAETALAQLIEVERAEHSTYFVEHAFLMRAYCLACVGRGNEAVLLLDHVAPDASWDYTDNLPDITPDLIRSLAKSTR